MKTVIELAKQAGWEYADDDSGFEPLWRFAELVRADEREACAGLCDRLANRMMSAEECADAIRARSGEQK